MNSEIGSPTSPDTSARFAAMEKDIEYMRRDLTSVASSAGEHCQRLTFKVSSLKARVTKLEAKWTKLMLAAMFFLASFATHGPSAETLKQMIPLLFRG